MSNWTETLLSFFQGTTIGMTIGQDSNVYQREYEHTPHTFTIQFDDTVEITREDIFPDGSAFILHGLLSDAECDRIQKAATDCGLADSGYSSRIRVCARVAAMCPEIGQVLFDRCLPFLEASKTIAKDAPQNGVPRDLAEGTYDAYGLNPCFRVVKYAPGGFFLPHFDGGFERTEEDTSIQTFMMYLNDGFEGGPTNFFSDAQLHYKPSDPENVIYSFQPKKGSCLIFNHRITHDGGVLISGEKWLFRSEIMFKKQ